MVVCYVCLEDGATIGCACKSSGLHDHCKERLVSNGFEKCSVCKTPFANDEVALSGAAAPQNALQEQAEQQRRLCTRERYSCCYFCWAWVVVTSALPVTIVGYQRGVVSIYIVAFNFFTTILTSIIAANAVFTFVQRMEQRIAAVETPLDTMRT